MDVGERVQRSVSNVEIFNSTVHASITVTNLAPTKKDPVNAASVTRNALVGVPALTPAIAMVAKMSETGRYASLGAMIRCTTTRASARSVT